ncbi:MAG: M67 family metallopeptidase [Anaerolineae bacterium]|nr:M67 family metallopeptidase [Anaerolineae bacterium]
MVRFMLDQAAAGDPEEVCGVLGGAGRQAFVIRALRNVAAQPHVRYAVDPGEQIAAMLEFEARGWELVGIYHSHPRGPAHPSETDITESYYPGVVYFIVSLVDSVAPQITAWLIETGRALPVAWRSVADA